MDSTQWIIVEILAVLIENSVFLYFLNNRFTSKYKIFWPFLITWCALICWGLSATFLALPAYDLIAHCIMLIYVLTTKQGAIFQKIIGVLMVWAIMLGTSFAGAGLASFLTSTTISHTLMYQDTSRLLSIIFIKMLQIVMFYILARKQQIFRNLKQGPVFVLSGAAIIDFIFIITLRAYIEVPDLSVQQNNMLIWLAIGSLMIMISIFLMYELFIREAETNVELAVKLQRLELESHFFKEIDAMYSDMRTWRHEYKNNLTAIRTLVAHDKKEKTLRFIDNIACESSRNNVTLQTGNLVLDAVVSSKLWLAQSQNIEVTIQAVYPENNRINDNDLCAIAGNLLDNAIEACERMNDTEEKRFIHFSLFVKSKSLFLSISNSYNDEIKRVGERYLTIKKTRFHGMGIPYVDAIVRKYNGHVLRSQNLGVFETHVGLPLVAPEKGE